MIRVLVIEDVRAVAEMIAVALRSKPDIEVIGPATSLEEIQTRIAYCDVTLVNAGKDSGLFLHRIRDIHDLDTQAKIVVIGLAGAPSFLLQCVGAGVTGYTLPDSSLDDLVRTIRAVHNNSETVMSRPVPAPPRPSSAAMASIYPAGEAFCEPRLLTRREREVLGLVQQGLTNLEIAQLLVIELGTVKNHVHNILRKLRVNSRRDTLHLSLASKLGGWKERRPDYSWAVSPLSGLDGPVYANTMARAASLNSSAK